MELWLKIYSDLHNEFGVEFEPQFTPEEIRRLDKTILVLAGDIDSKARGLAYAEKYHDIFKAVMYVPGNHDYYGITLNKTSTREKFTSEYENVHSLQYMDSVVIDGVLFTGGTLWTDLNKQDWFAVRNARIKMNDFQKIKELRPGSVYRKMSTDLWISEHIACKEKIAQQLARTDYDKSVVITHHAPSYKSIPERYQKSQDLTNFAYMSHLDELAIQADYWIHGHIHDNMDYMINDTVRVLANPRGYIPDYPNKSFDPYGLSVQIA